MGTEVIVNKKGRCVRQFDRAVQKVFDKGGSLRDGFKRIQELRHDPRIEGLSFKPSLKHVLGYSAIGLGSIVLYEYARAHGANFPDLVNVLKTMPFAFASETKLTGSAPAPPADYGKGWQSEQIAPEDWGKNFDANFPQDSHE